MAKVQTLYGSKRAISVLESKSEPLAPNNIFQNLPSELLEHIVSFLPIKEAAQQCSLGSNFRNSKSFNRKFMFGREFAIGRSPEFVTELVDKLFDIHKGDRIDCFQLHIDPVGVEELLDKWLKICMEKKIEVLDLFFQRQGYTLGADFVNQLRHLSTLKLVQCNLNLPHNLHSMCNLRSLILWHVPLSHEGLESLIAQCRILLTVDLIHCTGLSRVEIHASEHRYFTMLRIAGCKDLRFVHVHSPTLRSVHYCGHVPTAIRFIQATLLSEAFFNFAPAGNRRYLQASVLENLVCDLPNVTILTTSALIPEALTAKFRRGGVFGEVCYRFSNLQELHLFMDGALFCNPYDIVMFLKHCPLLENLFIDVDDYNFECGPYWELHQKPKLDKFDHYFDRLKFIKLKGFKFLQSELQLIKILLKKATHLEALVLVTPKNGRVRFRTTDGPKYSNLFDCWKSSPKVKIVLFEHLADHSRVTPSHLKFGYC